MQGDNSTPVLPLGRYRLDFLAQEPLEVIGFMGSAWRGALGHALKKTVCVTRDNDCKNCLLYRSCSYPYLFETPPPEDAEVMRRYNVVPHPYILQLPYPGRVSVAKGGRYSLGLILIGKAQQQLPYLIHALQKAGLDGIGPKRTTLMLVEVQQSQSADEKGWQTIYRPQQELIDLGVTTPTVPPPDTERLRVHLQTPFRTKSAGHLVTPKTFTFAHFFSPLMRRIAMLQTFHSATPLEVSFKRLTEQAKAVPIENIALQWQEWTRKSNRQHAKMQMGGVTGTFEIATETVAPFIDWLWLGQWTHNGKAATMGLGRYQLEFFSEE